jgi:hypothetical protein
MQSDRQERISERAYQIWLAEGRGHGRHDEHWQRAEREIAEEELRIAAALADRAAGTATSAHRLPPASGAKTAGTTAPGESRATPAAPAGRGGRRTPTGSSSS